MRARLDHLVRLHHEVLAEQRHVGDLPRRAEILEAATEERTVREHADGVGRADVRRDDVARIGGKLDRALRWRPALQLQDEPRSSGRQRRAQAE